MDLIKLKYFMTICEYGTVSAAEEYLHKLVKNEEKIKYVSLDPPITLSISLVWQKNRFLFSGMKRLKNFVEQNRLLK